MDSDRWGRVESLFLAAIERPPEQRAAFLQRACGNDAELRSIVEGMLKGDDRAPTILESVGPDVLDRFDEADTLSGLPRQFGPYEITELIGRGGMGVVYLARRADGQFDRTVALKVVRAPGLGGREDRWFRAEARNLARLEHPNIARLYDVGVQDGQAFIVMEFVDGEPLDRHCDARRLDLRGRIRLFLQVCEAVAHAHQQLIVHRDLKPSNILVAGDGSVRLLDFGISRLLEEDPSDVPAGPTIRALTPEYSSPEQIKGDPATTASDLYSLGVVMYELLTGTRPFAIASAGYELARAIVEKDVGAPSRSLTPSNDDQLPDGSADSGARAAKRGTTPKRLARRLSGDLDAIALKALDRDPGRRYGSVAELADDLERYLKGEPVLARTGSASYRARKFVRKHALGVAASAAVVVGLAGGLGVAIWQAREAAAQRDAARAEATRAERMRDFLAGIFLTADPTEGRADTITGVQILDRGALRVRAELASEPGLQAEMLDVIGSVYTNLSRFERADALLNEGLELRSALYGPRSAEVARSVDHLAALARARGSPAADSLSAEALERLLQAHGPDHPEVARGLVKAAERVLRADRDSAESLLRDAARIYAASEGDHALDVATLEYTTAYLHHAWGEYDLAIESYRDALRTQLERLGRAHPLTLTTQHNMGYLLQIMGRYPEADSALMAVLEARRAVYGEDHHKVANTLHALADLKYAQGELEEGERLVRRALGIRARLLGEDSGIVMDTRLLLASILEAAGRSDEAAGHFEAVLERGERGGGISGARALNNFAGALETRGDLEGAEALYRRSWAAYSRALGPTHPFTAIVQGNVAAVLIARGEFEQADPLARSSLAALREAYTDEHPTVAVSKMQLGVLECSRNDTATAETRLRDALSTLERTLPASHWRLGQARLRLGACLREMDRLVEAERMLLSSREIIEPQRYARLQDWRQLLSELHQLYRSSERDAEAAAVRKLARALEPEG